MAVEMKIPRGRVLSSSETSQRRWRLAVLLGLVALLALGSFVGVSMLMSTDSTRTASVLVASTQIHAGTTITAGELRVERIRADDPTFLSGLVQASQQSSVVGQTAALDVAAGSPLPAAVIAPQASADMWEVTLPVKRMPADIKAGDHVAILATSAGKSGDQLEIVVLQDVRVLTVQSGSADLWVPVNAAPQLEWYGERGGVVLAKQQPGTVHPNLVPGGLTG